MTSKTILTILRLFIPIVITLILDFFYERKLSIVIYIIITLLSWLIMLTYKVIMDLHNEKNRTLQSLKEIQEHISEIKNVYPYDSIEKIKKFDEGRIYPEQESIVNLLGTLYEELVLEGKMKRERHIQAVRYIYISKEIKKFINRVRQGVTDNTLTFDSPNSINVTKDLYRLAEIEKLDAISYPSLDFWNSRQGKQFLSRNKEAINEFGITINRYFIVNDTTSLTEAEELCNTLKIHQEFKNNNNLNNYNIFLVRKFTEKEIKNILGELGDLKFSKKPNSNELQAVPDTSLINQQIVSIWNFGANPDNLDEVRLIVKRTTVERIKNLFDFFNEMKINLPRNFDANLLLNLYNDKV